jgi:hypothetical protein
MYLLVPVHTDSLTLYSQRHGAEIRSYKMYFLYHEQKTKER